MLFQTIGNDLEKPRDGEVIEERTLKIWRAMVPDEIQFIDQLAWHDLFFPDAQRIPVLCKMLPWGLHPFLCMHKRGWALSSPQCQGGAAIFA